MNDKLLIAVNTSTSGQFIFSILTVRFIKKMIRDLNLSLQSLAYEKLFIFELIVKPKCLTISSDIIY